MAIIIVFYNFDAVCISFSPSFSMFTIQSILAFFMLTTPHTEYLWRQFVEINPQYNYKLCGFQNKI